MNYQNFSKYCLKIFFQNKIKHKINKFKKFLLIFDLKQFNKIIKKNIKQSS